MLFRTSSESNLRPIRRFTAKTVASGLVIAWRLAICPISRSPASVKPTIDGVVRLPSELGMTTGSPPSITATQLLVVPRSMPMTLGIESVLPPFLVPQGPRRSEQSSRVGKFSRAPHPPALAEGGEPFPAAVRGLATTTAAGRIRRSFSLYPLAISETTVPAGSSLSCCISASWRLGSKGFPTALKPVTPCFASVLSKSFCTSRTPSITCAGSCCEACSMRALEVVHHRQEVLEQPFAAEALDVLLLLHRALPVVVELRRGPQQALVGVLQPLARLAGALERLLELRLQQRNLVAAAGSPAAGRGTVALRHRPLLFDRRVRRDLCIVWNQVVSFSGRGNIAQRSLSPRVQEVACVFPRSPCFAHARPQRPARPPCAPSASTGECEGEAALACFDKGRRLLESRRPEVAQRSMEYVDQACSAGIDEACDLSDLAFKAPRKLSGRSPSPPPSVRSQHIRGTVGVRCTLDTAGLLRDCEVLESVPGMDAEVLDSLSTRRYEPATWGGNPVEVPFDVRVDVTPLNQTSSRVSPTVSAVSSTSGHHPRVVHPRRSDHAERADHLALQAIGRGDDGRDRAARSRSPRR